MSGFKLSFTELLGLGIRRPGTGVRYLLKMSSFYAKHRLCNRWADSTLFTHSPPIRFLIVGRTRSGSNLLRGALMSHPRAVALGEIFRRYRHDPAASMLMWGLPLFRDCKDNRAFASKDTKRFIETRVFSGFTPNVDAVGIKFLYPAVTNDAADVLLNTLPSLSNLRIIHVRRKNKLRAHLSLIKAGNRRENYRQLQGAGPKTPQHKIIIETARMLKAFEEIEHWESRVATSFSKNPLIEVFYEDVAEHFNAEMTRIQEHLGLKPRTLTPLTQRQENRRLKDQIANYSEVEAALRATPWEQFLEDETRE